MSPCVAVKEPLKPQSIIALWRKDVGPMRLKCPHKGKLASDNLVAAEKACIITLCIQSTTSTNAIA